MKYSIAIFALFSVCVQAKECKYPADPINWVLRYCGYETQTGDEIAIQESACFKSSQKDLADKNKCKTNEKFKSKVCQKFLMKDGKYPSLKDCLKDSEVKPFVAGG